MDYQPITDQIPQVMAQLPITTRFSFQALLAARTPTLRELIGVDYFSGDIDDALLSFRSIWKVCRRYPLKTRCKRIPLSLIGCRRQ